MIISSHPVKGQIPTISNVISAGQNNTLVRIPTIGLSAENVTLKIASLIGLDRPEGLIVTKVSSGGPAEIAGVHAGHNSKWVDGRYIDLGGDIILKVDNKTMSRNKDFYEYIRNKEIGDIVTLTLLRDQNKIHIPVVIAASRPLIFENPKQYSDPDKVSFSEYTTLNITRFDTTFSSLENQFGITMEYPSTWTVSSQTLPKSPDYVSIKFRSMPENSSDIMEYVEFISRKTYYPNIDEEVAVRGIENYVIVEKSTINFLGNSDSRRLVYTYIDPTFGNIKILRVATIKDGKLFEINYHAHQSRFNDYLPTVEKMVSSLSVFGIKDYDNYHSGVGIRYPANWSVTESKSESIFKPAIKTIFKIPQDSINNIFNNRFEILNYDSNNSTHEIAKQTIELKKETPTQYPNLREELQYNEYMPFSLVNYQYLDPVSRKIIKVTQFFIKQKSKIYDFSYIADENNYYKNLKTIAEMVNSLKFFELLPYENLNLGIESKYPSNWNVTGSSKTITFYPQQDSKNFTRVKIDVIRPLVKPSTIEGLFNEIIREYEKTNGEFFDFRLTDEPKKTSLGDVPVVSFNYSYSDPDYGIINATETIAFTNDKIYKIRFQDGVNHYLQHFALLQNIAKSTQIFQWLRYENPDLRIIFQYPNKLPWKLIKIDDKTFSLLQHDQLNSIPIFSIPNLSLSIYPYAKSIDNLGRELVQNYTRSGFNILNIANILINTNFGANVTAYRITFGNNDSQIKSQFYIYKYQGNAYIINYGGIADTGIFTGIFTSPYDRYLPTVEKIIRSLNLIEPLPPVKNLSKDFKRGFISKITYPYNWNLTDIVMGSGFQLISPYENDLDFYPESLIMGLGSIGSGKLGDSVSSDLNYLKGNYTNFRLIDSHETLLLNSPAHQIVFTYVDSICECDIKVMSIYTIRGNKLYNFFYSAELNKFSSYLPIIESVINSMNIDEKQFEINKSGLPLNGGPVDLAVNPVTNRLYVAIPETRQVQVIDGARDRIIDNITVGAFPNAIAVNIELNRIYVASPETDVIYVIDGITNKIVNKVQAGPMVGDVNVDTNEFGSYSTLVFVTNQGNNSLSIIDDVKGKVVANVKTGINPYGIGIDTIKNRAYVTTSSGIDVIDYMTDLSERKVVATYYGNFTKNFNPAGIIVNPNTSKAYVADSGGNTVSVLDTSSDELLYEIKVGLFPNSMAFNPSNKKIYVSNSGNNTVSIIDSTIDRLKINSTVQNVTIDSIPYDVAVNPKSNMIYLANYDSKTISTVNATTNKPVSAVTFHIYPANAGHIECNQNKIPENSYVRVDIGSQCRAISNYGFVFSSWSSGAPSNSTDILGNKSYIDSLATLFGGIFNDPSNDAKASHIVTQYWEYTANFISLPPVIQSASPYLSIGALIMVILAAAITPTFTRKLKIMSSKTFSNLASKNVDDTFKKKEGESNEEESNILSRGEILTIDATVIIGVLIFLTFTEGFQASEQSQINIITASIVFPFAISAIVGVTKTEKFATRLMIAGFINLMISVILIAIMKIE